MTITIDVSQETINFILDLIDENREAFPDGRIPKEDLESFLEDFISDNFS